MKTHTPGLQSNSYFEEENSKFYEKRIQLEHNLFSIFFLLLSTYNITYSRSSETRS